MSLTNLNLIIGYIYRIVIFDVDKNFCLKSCCHWYKTRLL